MLLLAILVCFYKTRVRVLKGWRTMCAIVEFPSATYVQCTLHSISFIRVSNAWVGLIVGRRRCHLALMEWGTCTSLDWVMLPSFLLLLFFLHLQVEHLGAFRIVHSVEAPDGTKSETVFRFHHKSKLQAQAAVTVGGVCVGVFLVLWYAHSFQYH